MSSAGKVSRYFIMKCVMDGMVINLFPNLDRVISGERNARAKKKVDVYEYADGLKCCDCRDYKKGFCKGKEIVGLSRIIEQCLQEKARKVYWRIH